MLQSGRGGKHSSRPDSGVVHGREASKHPATADAAPVRARQPGEANFRQAARQRGKPESGDHQCMQGRRTRRQLASSTASGHVSCSTDLRE
eukprot:5807515-Alexandrium_andersonii.AAC.1